MIDLKIKTTIAHVISPIKIVVKATKYNINIVLLSLMAP